MVRPQCPELKKYMDRRVFCEINAGRKITGIVRGYDLFMNLVLDDTYEELETGDRISIGSTVVRGNSIVVLEAMERIL